MSQELYILEKDKIRLLEIIDKTAFQKIRTNVNLKELEAEINKARVIDQDDVSHTFIKMNSKVTMTVDQEEEELTLVYPEQADVKNNKISILSPIGTAILGYSTGSCIEWKVPSGTVQIKIQDISD